ncbi:hypothetical protein EW146_g5912 [Bondarzewia mesenterica]|uniref:Uncharacterized protein n=1 Tax=Bondarzewia mesenterica TaxID=1095465 RepID=A0A4S4LQQ3_9AGAM|nr:hypothetical protein EW146_g5912 [Bondarzewia mesenterica]
MVGNLGIDHQDLERTDYSIKLLTHYWDQGTDDLMTLATRYPRSSKVGKYLILMAHKQSNDPYSSVLRYTDIQEQEDDRVKKRMIIRDSGLKDEDLRWVTIPDPCFMTED